MKKVINNKVYNTETAELLHSWDNGIYSNDFRFCEESLYVTKKGNYFLKGLGGAMSKYAKTNGNTTSGSSDILLLTKIEALTWLEEHDGEDVLIDRFADDIEEG